VVGLFSVEPGRQEDLLAAIDATGAVLRHRPGFRGSACYAGVDGTRVVNISHWDSRADLDAARADPAGTALARRMFEIATPDPIQCVLRSEHHPPSGTPGG
jgi:heme-degrading monooxygenase HmoA